MDYINSYLKMSNAADEIRAGTYKQSSSRNNSLVSRREPTRLEDDELDPLGIATGYLTSIKDMFSEEENLEGIKEYLSEKDMGGLESSLRPYSREDSYRDTGLMDDPEFNIQLERLLEKYPNLSKSEVFRIIGKESSNNPRAVNEDSGAVGLFQFIPEVAAELGFTPEEILDMAPAEQLRVYEKYLDRWNYSGKNSLAIMQAAPSYANKSPDTVVYKKGSKAWEQNPGWRPDDGGDITIKSINDFYGNYGRPSS